MKELSNKYNLEDRTARFGEDVITVCQSITQAPITKPLTSQLVRSATSIGANYAEANGASSKQDFRNKIFICKKESQETKHWLRMVAHAVPEKKSELHKLHQECQELTLIFNRITSTLTRNAQRAKNEN